MRAIKNNRDYNDAHKLLKHLSLKPEYGGSRRPAADVKRMREKVWAAIREYEGRQGDGKN